jgi:hypothetical protein
MTRRFDLSLFIVHPTLKSTDLTAEIGLQPHYAHSIGEPRATPAGTPLSGKHKDTRWRYGIRHEVEGSLFAVALNDFVKELSLSGPFFEQIKTTGGQSQLIVSFLGDGHYGDTLPAATLASIVGLHLDFGIEVFSSRQA